MLSRLPRSVDAFKHAALGTRFSGTFAVAEMARLLPLLHEGGGEVAAELVFGTDAAGTPNISGKVQGRLTVICQRCFEPMVLEIDAPVHVGLARSEAAAAALSNVYEPCVVQGEHVSLLDLVEDELLLALPIVPRHEHACRALPATEAESTQRENPFAVLAELRSGKNRPE